MTILSSRPRRLALLLVALLALAAGVYELTPGRRLKARHESLLEWARGGAPGDFARDFAAADYHDQWGHSAADVVERVRAARFGNPGLAIDAGQPEIIRDGDTAAVYQVITIHPGDGESRRHDFHFTWHRGNFWPWSWKLRAVEAPGLHY